VANGIAFRAFDCSIAVVSGCQRTLASLERFLLPSFPRAGPDAPGADILLRVEPDGRGFQLFHGDAAVPVRDFRALVVAVVRLIDERMIGRLKRFTAVHAGVVEFAGRALLLPGGTHAGKSSLVAELLRRGAGYFSDEYALIDAQGLAHAYPRPLMLRNGGSDQFPVTPQESGARVGGGPAPVAWILALKYEAAAPWRIAAVPRSEAFLTLLSNTPHFLAENPRILDPLRRASAGAACFAGQRGDAVEAAGEILRLVAG
jgi:hypothetical protein